MELYWTYIT